MPDGVGESNGGGGLLRRHTEELAGVGAFDFHADWKACHVHQLMFSGVRAVHEPWATADGTAVRELRGGLSRGGCHCRGRRSTGIRLAHRCDRGVWCHWSRARALFGFRSFRTAGRGGDAGGNRTWDEEGALSVWADDFGAS